MANKQVVTVGPTGSLSGLQFKSRGVDLRKFGHAQIERISEIVWIEDYQAWGVRFLEGEWGSIDNNVDILSFGHINYLVNRCNMLAKTAADMMSKCVPFEYNPPCNNLEVIILFDEYDAAVEFEVAFIQWCVLNGKSHLIKECPGQPMASSEPGQV